ncbi:uncharacterized protein LOC131215027 [Anopheles bellator]|uniref:uncharacterized protein LOC131215027 n=1 Tax=Anopheles bellator TaxID=139047 RepID=UPI0026494556|nr:uncharacterized protein LOC131215027 [Anopheles bellator]
MVSPSKAKLSRIASQQPQEQAPPQRKSTTSNNKVKLVKGPKPLVHHRFFLDIERHQIAAKIESTIKELGGSIEFFLSENITHFITDKYQHQQQASGGAVVAAATGEQRPEERLSLVTTATPGWTGGGGTSSSLITQAQARQSQHSRAQQRSGSRQLSHQHPTHQQPTRGQYVNDIAPATSRTSSPCPPPPAGAAAAAATPSSLAAVQQQLGVVAFEGAASSSAGGGCSGIASATTTPITTTLGFDGRVKATQPAVPRSRADAMLQRVRQQQQGHQHQYHTSSHQQQQQQPYHLLHSSPLNYQSPTPPTAAIIGSTPTKRLSETTSPSTFYSSSHHKQQPSPCHSPATPASVEQQVGVPTAPAPKHQNSPIQQLASSWGTPVWSPEQALKFLRKVLDSVRNENHPQPSLGASRDRAGGRAITAAGTGGGRHHHRHHHQHRGTGGGQGAPSSSVRSRHVHHLKGRYLKIESASNPGQHRPFYQEFKRWPDLLLRHPDSGFKKAPFADIHEQFPLAKLVGGATTGRQQTVARTGSPFVVGGVDRMTRKPAGRNITAKSGGASGDPKTANVKKRAPQQDDTAAAVVESAAGGQQKPAKDCGYCEICRIEYDSLAVHVESNSHRGFVQNDGNFLSLDRLIGSIDNEGVQEAVVGGCVDIGLVGDTAEAERPFSDDGGGGAAADLGGLFLQQHTQGTGREDAFGRPLKLAAKGAPVKQPHSSETTGKVTTVTTSTTAAVDDKQQTIDTEDTGKETKSLIVGTEATTTTTTPKSLSVPLKSTGTGGGLVGGRECATNIGQAKRKRRITSGRTGTTDGKSKATKVKCAGEFAGDCEPPPSADHGSDGDDRHGSEGNTTAELIKLAISSVVSSFEGGNEQGDKRESTGRKNNRKNSGSDRQGIAGGPASVSEEVALSNRSYNQHKLHHRDRDIQPQGSNVEEGSSVQRATIEFGTKEKPVSRDRTRSGAKSSRGRQERRYSNRLAASSFADTTIRAPAATSTTEEVTTTEDQPAECSLGMFGRRSAIHHHPHNQLSHHHKHQKHKLTLSAFLPKQHEQPFREPGLETAREKQADESATIVGQDGGSSVQQSSDAHHDHAVGMKVISDFRHEPQQQQPQVELKKKAATANVLMVAGIDGGQLVKHPAAAAAGRRKRRRVVGTAVQKGLSPPGTEERGNQKQQQQSPEPESTMGLKASTTAMNKHHHLPHDALSEGGGGGVGAAAAAAAARTRFAEAALLECEGLDPKNTKRISLGLRQNPKRANLNEDFTSLLDETLERSRMAPAGTTTVSTASSVSARKAQSRIRHGQKAKEKAEKKSHGSTATDQQHSPSASAATGGEAKRMAKKNASAAALETIKVRGIRWRAPSPTTRPPVKSPLLYKVIDPPPASAGTTVGSRIRRSSSKSKQQQPLPTKNGLIVKIRRVRQSELSLLNDEAENFMFPKKDESSSEADTDDDRQTSSEGFRHHHQAQEGHRTAVNNYSIDLQSSSECDLVKQEFDEEDDADGGGQEAMASGQSTSRKRKKPGSKRVDSVESEPSSSSSSSSAVAASAKRARLDPKATSKARRKAGGDEQDDCQDPPGGRMRFREAPIQPGPVAAVDEPATGDDGSGEDDDNSGGKQQRANRKGVSAGRRGGRGRGKRRHQPAKQLSLVKVPEQDSAEGEKPVARPIELEDTTARGSPSLTAPFACTCYGVSAANRSRGRGCGRGGSRRGRRGRGGAGGGRWATRGRGRMPLCVCRLQSLDATRMPPPAAVGGGGEESQASVTAAATPASRKSGASKTKTTPPLPKPRRGGAGNQLAKEEHHYSSASSVSPTACGSSSSSSGGGAVVGKGKEDGMGAVFKWINFRKRCEEIEPYRFAFERVPSLEPWYETFQRQDDGTEKVYEYFGSTGYRKLPYEMGPLPALSQNCCILNYKVVGCRKSNRNAASQPTSSSSSSMEPPSPGGKQRGGTASGSGTSTTRSGSTAGAGAEVGDLDTKKSPSALSSLPLKKRKLLLQQEQSANSSTAGTSTATDGGSGSTSTGTTTSGSRIARLIAGSDRPRKSPREHASTLAILSLLSQQQHRKRAAAIKILTSPKKATTTTTQSLLATRGGDQQHDADSGGAENKRPSSATDCAANGGIKFEKPLFPDTNYVNNRTLCQELDAFLSSELEQVCGRSTPTTVLAGVKRELLDDEDEVQQEDRLPSPRPSTSELHSERTKIKEESERLSSGDDAFHLTLPPSALHHGVAIERHNLPVSKRDLVDVLQTVGTEPPLSLKLVQRCETVLKKIVQFDRKPRSMLSSSGGFGPTIGLRLFDGGSSGSPVCGGVGGAGGVGSGGSFLKKRINRTGWPTNKRKIGTRTRQQLRCLVPPKKAHTLVKKEIEATEEVEENSEDEKTTTGAAAQEQPAVAEDDEEADQPADDADDDEASEADEEDEDEEEEDGEDDDDGGETVVEVVHHRSPRRQRGPCKKQAAQSSINSSHVVVVSHEKTDHRGTVRPRQENGPVEQVVSEEKEEDRSLVVGHSEAREQARGRRRRKSSSASVAKQHLQQPPPETSGDRGVTGDVVAGKDKQEAADLEPRRPVLFDSMPTLRAALMRDNSSQLLQKPHSRLVTTPSSVLLPSSLTVNSPTSSVPKHPSGRPSAVETLEPSAVESERSSSSNGSSSAIQHPLVSPTGNRGSGNPTTGGSSAIAGGNCGKYVTKTTTTMTRVDYDGALAASHPVQATNTKSPSSKRKSGDTAHQEESVSARPLDVGTASAENAGSTLPVVIRCSQQQQRHQRSVPEDDDKECDSISSRSIFVSDDCDTTSSSTFLINAPEETGSQHASRGGVVDRVPAADPRLEEHRRKEESSENEDEEEEDEEEQEENDQQQLLLVESSSRRQRQQRQQRRAGAGSLNHRSPRTPSERIRNKMVKNRRMALLNRRLLTVPTTTTSTTQSTQTILAKRRTQQPVSLLPPPPVMMMPLSPPLTTSTSSSSSSSCADDKPMSPAATVLSGVSSKDDPPVPESIVTPTVAAAVISPPSNVKTRSSTKRGPGGRSATTAGGRRTYPAANSGNEAKSTLVDATTIPIPPSAPKESSSRRVKKAKAKFPRRKQQLQQVVDVVGEEEEAVPVKKRRKKQHIVLKEEASDDDTTKGDTVSGKRKMVAKEPESTPAMVVECRDKRRSMTPPPRGKCLKLKVFNHNNSHFTYETLSLVPFVVENGVDNPDTDDDDEDADDADAPATGRRDAEVMSPDDQLDIEHLLEEHLVEEVKGTEVVDEEEDREDERVEMLELMEVEEDNVEDHLHNNRHRPEESDEEVDDEEDAFLTGDEVELEDEEDEEYDAPAKAVVNRITNDDHPYANSSSDDHRRYQIHRHHPHHHRHRHESGQSTDEGEDSPEYVEVEELEEHDVVEEANDLEEEQLSEEEEEEDDTDEDDSGAEEVIHHHHVRKYPAPGRGTVPIGPGPARHNKVTSNEVHVVVPASSSAISMGTTNSTTTTTLVSPNKYSPRKLRKPRGRWYRER